MTRRTELLIAAAEALENGEDPFSGGFLSEHEVTSGECINLARQCAIGARIVARGLDDPRSAEGIATLTAMVSA